MKEDDINYIAGLEKAIKKKYGEEAIQNPASYCNQTKEEDYIKQLQEFVDKQKKFEAYVEPENVNGVLITQKLFNKDSKTTCPVCATRKRKIEDEIYYIKFRCCYKCYIKFVENREERWLKGWRPENVTKST